MTSQPDPELERLVQDVAARPGGRALLEQLDALDEALPLAAVRLPRRAHPLDFFDPKLFPDRDAVREFVQGDLFASFIALARSALAGRDAFGDLSEHVAEETLRSARESLFFILGDLATLAGAAAEPDVEPLAFDARLDAFSGPSRIARLTALAELAALEAHEGADPETWLPVFETLRAATSEPGRAGVPEGAQDATASRYQAQSAASPSDTEVCGS